MCSSDLKTSGVLIQEDRHLCREEERKQAGQDRERERKDCERAHARTGADKYSPSPAPRDSPRIQQYIM